MKDQFLGAITQSEDFLETIEPRGLTWGHYPGIYLGTSSPSFYSKKNSDLSLKDQLRLSFRAPTHQKLNSGLSLKDKLQAIEFMKSEA